MTTYHVFGDTGGHFRPLYNALVEIGFNPETYELPENVVIIHCGDLIHKGPLSNEIVAVVNRIMRTNPNQWIQLLGNHELNYFPYAPTFWTQKGIPVTKETIDTLLHWYETGAAKFAFGLPATVKLEKLEVSARPKLTIPDKPFLFTHAGVGWDYWAEHTGKERNIAQVVEKINNVPMRAAARAGTMLYGPGVDSRFGPIGPAWAHSIYEVWETWYGRNQPFIQIQGHTNPFDFERKVWHASTPRHYRDYAKLNPQKRVSIALKENNMQISIDPGFEARTPSIDKQPYITFVEQD